ncbi:hypothetical protein BRD20_04030 [Halobacteriales archaeon SW_8_65_20]|nr:MAG: hypothetical protein BRD20_04030 [Halobacteriales archaeon SW_8_65_20]
MSDRSLSEFDGAESDASDDADSGSTKPDATDDFPATTQFSPDGAPCEACGDAVTRRWHDDGGFVCADCKEW